MSTQQQRYPLAERFKEPQGEGLYTGTPMAFMRLVGCSVGQHVCTACDTDYNAMRDDMGGGLYTAHDLVEWVKSGPEPYRHVCLTGGEPLDRNLSPLIAAFHDAGLETHVETSGTKHPEWLDPRMNPDRKAGTHAVSRTLDDGRTNWRWMPVWMAVSPKPGYLPEMVQLADEVKVILGGLGDGPGWPTVDDAVLWARQGKLVYVQPRNSKNDVDGTALAEAIAVVRAHPLLRLSVQMHKFIKTR